MNALAEKPIPDAQSPQPTSPAPLSINLPPAVPVDEPRADSILKILPEDRQFDIAEYSRTHSLNETIDWLSTTGIGTSRSALSRFLVWYRLREQKAQHDLVIQELLAQAAQQDPDLTAEQLYDIGHMFFSGLALANQDPKTWFLAQRIALHRSRLHLAAQKYRDPQQALQPGTRDPNAPALITEEGLKKIMREIHLI